MALALHHKAPGGIQAPPPNTPSPEAAHHPTLPHTARTHPNNAVMLQPKKTCEEQHVRPCPSENKTSRRR
eukprot:11402788-Prorocentrum_lima.AAC.1